MSRNPHRIWSTRISPGSLESYPPAGKAAHSIQVKNQNLLKLSVILKAGLSPYWNKEDLKKPG